MKVKALTKGQYKGVMYQPGDVFEIDRGETLAPWMQEVKIVPLKVAGTMLPKDADFEQPQTDAQPKADEEGESDAKI